jgi:hypothetical protein
MKVVIWYLVLILFEVLCIITLLTHFALLYRVEVGVLKCVMYFS